ncbi:tetratricopeptide repeat protein [Mesorhizobium sp. ISC11]|uniref:tetratricopeptide repeat protein n=1 Tax=Mesorhizobium sp. ISC11 TaxID=3076428 RepID=UPI00301E1BD5
MRAEVRKVLASGFDIAEYFVTHTGPNDGRLDRLATALTQEQAKLGRNLIIRVWGWGTLQERIATSDVGMRAFDPTVGLFAEGTRDAVEAGNRETQQGFERLSIRIDAVLARLPADPSATDTALEAPLDREIDRYRKMIDEGNPRNALKLLEGLWKDLGEQTTGRIRFRVKANIGHCRVQLGDEQQGADDLLNAADYWPEDEKSVANKILALSLKGQFPEAFEFASSSLEKFPDSELVGAYLIQACRDRPLKGSPLDLLPEKLRSTEQVAITYIDHLRYREQVPEWWEVAHASAISFPESRQLRLNSADATVDRLTRKVRDWVRLSDDERAEAMAASKVLEEQYESIRQHDVPARRDHLAYITNYLVSLHTMGAMEKASTVIQEALRIAPTDQNLLALGAQIGFEVNDTNLLDVSFPKLERSGNSLLLATQIAARRSDWAFLRSVTLTETETLPETERDVVAALIKCAHAKNVDSAAAWTMATDLVAETENNPRASIIAAGLARDLDAENLETQAFQNAISAANDSADFSSRAMIAHYAMAKDLYGIVIRMLDGRVDLSQDNSELRMLANAHAYAIPSRASGGKFFESLEPSLRRAKRYLPLEGIYHYHSGDLDEAETCFRSYLELAPNDCRALILLAQTTGRKSGSYQSIADLIESLSTGILEGSPLDKMRVAQLILRMGRTNEAIRFGYEVLKEGRNDPSTNLHYVGLILIAETADVLRSPGTAGNGAWVEITGPDQQVNSFLIEEGPDRPVERIYGLSHRYAQQTLGKAVGDEIVVSHPAGDQVWQVSQIKSRYLHAFHDITAKFNERFPDHPGFWTITTRDGDVSQFLDVTRKHGERRDRTLEAYKKGLLPIQLMAETGGGNVIAFMEAVRATGGEIKSCRGTSPERESALCWIARSESRGVVLDTLTFWTVVDINAIDVLKSVFGELVLARSSVDDIGELKEDYLPDADRKTGSATFYNGEFYLVENTPEIIEKRRTLLEERESVIRNEIRVSAVRLPSNLPAAIEERLAQLGIDLVGSAAVAAENGMILLSDDLAYRTLAYEYFKTPTTWLQPVFMYAQRRGLINMERYSELSAKLAERRHGFVSVEPLSLEALLPTGDTISGTLYEKLADYLGTKDADFESHIGVSAKFLQSIWSRSKIGLPETSATGLLLENITRFRDRDSNGILARLMIEVSRSRFNEYVARWKRGHFLHSTEPLPGAKSAS